jgi:hypothetical protein
MYLIPRPKTKIHLIRDDGDMTVYEDYEDFINHTSYWFVDKHVVNTFKEWLDDWFRLYSQRERRRRYIVRDKFNSVFTKTELLNDIYELNRKKTKYTNLHYRFRHDPVPRTGKRNWSFRNWYKTPKTTQEKRWNEAHKEYTRGRRGKSYLADAWDDYPRSDSFIKRSWKKRRKRKQWM